MRKVKVTIVFIATAALGAATGIHWMHKKESASAIHRIQSLSEKRAIASELIVSMEKYRTSSNNFRRLGPQFSQDQKQALRTAFNQKFAALDAQPSATPQDKILSAQVAGKVSEFISVSNKVEANLYTRDFYSRPDGVKMHEEIIADLVKIRELAEAEGKDATASLDVRSKHSMTWMFGSSATVLVMFALLLLINYFKDARPLRALSDLARRFDEGESPAQAGTSRNQPLRGAFGSIEATLVNLCSAVQSQRLERHRFIAAVATDIRAPLNALKMGLKGLNITSSETPIVGESSQASQARSLVDHAIFRLNRALDDLSDIVESEQSHLKLDEKIVDLGNLLRTVANRLAVEGQGHQIRVASMPTTVWTYLDPQKFERSLMHLVTKLMNHTAPGNAIEMVIEKRSTPAFRGLEILIYHSEAMREGRAGATGPEQDVLKHWVNESGYGMGLARKLIQAHGGSVTASGVAGTGVLFVVKIPQERIAMGSHRPIPSLLAIDPMPSLEALGV